MFVAPAIAAAGVAAVSVPIAIHLLSKSRRKQQGWAAMRFLMAAYKKKQRRMKLEQWILLALRCLMVLVLGLAIGGLRPEGLLSALGGLGSERVVHVVIDDTLTNAVVSVDDEDRGDRFVDLVGEASQRVEALSGSDRVWVWPLSVQAPVLKGGTKQEALDVLSALVPLASGRALPEALPTVLEAAQATGGSLYWYSGWARGDGDLEEPIAWSAGDASAVAPLSVFVSRPLADAPNVQVQRVEPAQAVFLAQDQTVTVEAEVTVARFGGPMVPSTLPVTVSLWTLDASEPETGTELMASGGFRASAGSGGRLIGQATVSTRFGAQQQRASAQVVLSTDVVDAGLLTAPLRPLAIQATLSETDRADNTVALDDQAHAAIWAQRRIRVGVVDDGFDAFAVTTRASSGAPAPGAWLGLALNPDGQADAPIRLQPVSWEDGAEAVTEAIDALYVLSPASVPETAWPVLNAWVERGGVVWLTPPADPTAGLNQTMLTGLAAPWRVAVAEKVYEEPVSLLSGVRGPNTLRRLTPDWVPLVEAVTVSQIWPISDLQDEDANVWLRTAAGDPWHVVAPRGRGALVWTGSAFATAWSDLPARPLFVPLVQETLRRLVGGRPSSPQPLGPAVPGGTRVHPVTDDDGALPETTLATVADGAANAMDRWLRMQPGVYRNDVADTGMDRYTVWAPALDAGDTQAISEALLAQRFDALGLSGPTSGDGGWALMDKGGATGSGDEQGTTLTRSLLVLLLVLVLLELVLSRWFSHAVRHGEAHASQRFAQWVMNTLHGQGVATASQAQLKARVEGLKQPSVSSSASSGASGGGGGGGDDV